MIFTLVLACAEETPESPSPAAVDEKVADTVAKKSAWTIIEGANRGERAATWATYAGDLDGDGVGDFAIGSHLGAQVGTESGVAYVVYGPSAKGTRSVASVDAILTGTAAGDRLGWSLRGVGDVDGDGFDDLAVPALRDATGAASAGAVWIVGAPSGSGTVDTQGFRLYSEKAYERAGSSVDGGDFDGDGDIDLAIGAFDADKGAKNAGALYIVAGPVTAEGSLSTLGSRVEGDTAEAFAGRRVRSAGDVDGDGVDDILVASLTTNANAGATWLLLGPVTATSLTDADALITGAALSESGASVGKAGDLDGDGLGDIFIGAPGTGSGIAFAVQGPVASGTLPTAAFASWTGERSGDQAGIGVESADVDGDGSLDVLVSANREATNDRGAVYVVYGAGSGVTPLALADQKIVGSGKNDNMGLGGVIPAANTAGDTALLLTVPGMDKSKDEGGAYLYFP